MEKGNDISKRTVLILLILTLVVSVVGTWTMLSKPTAIYRTIELGEPQAGEVKVGINPPLAPTEPVAPVESEEDGKVAVNILK